MNSTDYNSIIAELRQEYLESFPAKFELFRKLFEDKDFSGIELEYHKLKGTGKTYGAPEISTVAGLMEAICHHQGSVTETQFLMSMELLDAIGNKYLSQKDFSLERDSRYSLLTKDLPA